MATIIPVALFNLACSWLQCEIGAKPPFLHISPNIKTGDVFKDTLIGRNGLDIGPLAFTKSGSVEGFTDNISENRQIFSFTGIPYAEPPKRFGDPVLKRPWRGTLQAKSPSPFCVQANGLTMGMIRGSENCLYLDIHTPYLPDQKESKCPVRMPVIVMIPAGANAYGRSRFYGPRYLLRENVIFVPLNVRAGAFGFLSTGDEVCPGNLALKDQALAIKWLYQNIEAFCGDPQKIIVSGLSSGAYASLLMLYTKHEAKNYVAGIIAISGSPFGNHGLDATGRVQDASNILAASVGCPTSGNGRSREMVECLRKLDPYDLGAKQRIVFNQMPPMTKMWGPTIEPDVPNAFISELPEVQYEKGTVAPTPVILSRTEDEATFVLQFARMNLLQAVRKNWYEWMPKSLRLGIRGANRGREVSYEESQLSLHKISQYYFNKTTPPRFTVRKDWLQFMDLFNDNMYFAPMWKGIELHHKVAPTYVYLQKHKTFSLLSPVVDAYQRIFTNDIGSTHATDYLLLISNSRTSAEFPPGSDFEKASRNLINMISNFGFYGKPLYRTENGTLLNLWKPIESMKNPMVLEVGLVRNISMIRDPLAGSRRMKIWDEVKF